MYELDTPRLQLRPLQQRDEALYCRLYTDPEVMRHIAPPLTAEAALRGFRAACRLARIPGLRSQYWAISERIADADIGILALVGPDMEAGSAEVGTMLLPAGQGRGLAAEAQAALLDRLFSDSRWRMVWSRHLPANGAVVSLKLKLGFLRTGPSGHEVRWEITRERWNACRRIAADVARTAEAR